MTAPGTAEREIVEHERAPRPVVLRHRVEYAGIRAAVGAFGALGFHGASNLGARLGRLGYHLGIRRYVVTRQIEAAFPEWSRERVLDTARAAYESLGRTSIEAALLSRCSREDVLALFDGHESWGPMEDAMRSKRGFIFVTGHLGNWEVLGTYIASRVGEFAVIARQQENPLFDAYVNRTRTRLGMTVVWDGDAVRKVPRVLRDGGGVGVVIDQGAAGLASTWVPFFGRLAKTPRGAATFALRLKVPVVFGCALRRPDGGFRVAFEAVPVRETGDKNADVDRIVADCTAALERWVRQAPEQYFWHHRRWKYQQPGTPPELGNPL